MKCFPHVLMALVFLAVGILVMNAVCTYPAQAYTRDVSGSDSKAILIALEALITDAAALEVDIAALEVDLAAIEVLNTTIAGDTTAIETAVEIMDDWDSTHDSAASADGPQGMLAYDSTKPTAVGDGDSVRGLGDEYGRSLAGWEPEKWQATATSADASSTELVVKAGTSAKKIAVLFLKVSCDTSLTITVEDEDDNALDVTYVAARGGFVARFPPEAPLIIGTADKNLQVQTSGAGNVTVTATGYLYD
jgi:hypothetical protein